MTRQKTLTKYFNYHISEKVKFQGPCQVNSNNDDCNYGIFVGVGLTNVLFYFIDANNMLKMILYKLEMPRDNMEYGSLSHVYECKPHVKIADHSPNFEIYLGLNENNRQQIYDHFLEGKQRKHLQNAETFMEIPLKETERIQWIVGLNKVVEEYLSISADAETHFISDNELVFRNDNNMVMCFDFVKRQEVFNLT
mmetsp:Transcript_38897/g.37227  ORF Transcript_38897/g.37227 Transcript_38897/m.37227 type:complete len:195 (-) Transcript_38897:976-1560(-)